MSAPSISMSVVICCHNSARVIPPTLAHLAHQIVSPATHWEIIIVDNGSTDGTADIAKTWAASAPVPVRVLSEPRLGLAYARAHGVEAARGEIITFVDDDNWLCRDWV